MTTQPKIYLIGSLRNPAVPEIGNEIRAAGFDVFDDWYAAGPEADDCWREYEILRGHTFEQALEGRSGKHVYNFDHQHLLSADAGILLTPAGKSGHLELGFLAGQGKKTMTYFTDPNPERWDVMYQFVDRVVFNKEKLMETLGVWFKTRINMVGVKTGRIPSDHMPIPPVEDLLRKRIGGTDGRGNVIGSPSGVPSIPPALMCESWKHVYPLNVRVGESCHCGKSLWNPPPVSSGGVHAKTEPVYSA